MGIKRQIVRPVSLLAAMSFALSSCGQTGDTKSNRTSSSSSVEKNSAATTEDASANEKPSMTVEEVVQGFQLGDELPDQVVSDSDLAAWEKSLVSEEQMRPADAEIGGTDMRLVDVVADEREIVDLRVNDTGIRNQGSEGTCTAFATVASMENLIKRFYRKDIDISERHHWTTYANYQTTTSLSKAKSATIVSEASWPYNGRKPSGNLASLGVAKLNAYKTTKLSLQPVVDSLRKGEPVVIAVGVLSSMMNPKQGGIIQGGYEKRGAGHAIAVTGAIIDARVPGGGYFIIKNSWGKNWGDKGYGYAAFDYCQRTWCSAYNISDASLYEKGIAVAKPKFDDVPSDPNVKPDPTPIDPKPDTPAEPSVEPKAADFKLVGNPSNRRSLFLGRTSYYLSIDAQQKVLNQIKSIQYAPSQGGSYTVRNGSAADVDTNASNLSSPGFTTRAKSVTTEEVIVTLRSGTKVTIPSITFSL